MKRWPATGLVSVQGESGQDADYDQGMNIDVVLVNYHSSADVCGALAQLGPWHEGVVWVVDNSEDVHEAARLAAWCAHRPWVRLRVAPRNLGFGQGCNLVWEESRAERVLLLNPDARIDPTDVHRLAMTLAERPDWAAVSPRMFWDAARGFVLPPATAQSPLHTLGLTGPGHLPGLAEWLGRRHVAQTQAQMRDGAPLLEVPMLAGAVLMLRREAVLQAGGLFDPGYFMFFEDADLCARLRRAGWGLGIEPAASAVHTYRHKAYKAALMTQAQRLYLARHHPASGWVVPWLARTAPQYRRALARRRVCASLADWQRLAPDPGEGVLAFSPALGMRPAACRPGQAAPFHPEEWALLEPGCYAVLTSVPGGRGATAWVTLEKTPPDSGRHVA